MVGPGDYLASWVITLFAMRLEIVRFPNSFQCCVSPTWPPHLQNFNGQVCYWRSNWDLLTLATVIAYTTFLWDYILTFEMEVDLVWKSKWNFMKGLYLFQRYLPFTQLVLFVHPYCQSDVISILSCSIIFYREHVEHSDGDWVSEGTLR